MDVIGTNHKNTGSGGIMTCIITHYHLCIQYLLLCDIVIKQHYYLKCSLSVQWYV